MFAHDYSFKFNKTLYNKVIENKGYITTETELLEASEAIQVMISYEKWRLDACDCAARLD